MHLLSVERGSVAFTVLDQPDRELKEAEPAVLMHGPFTVQKLAKPGGNYLKVWPTLAH